MTSVAWATATYFISARFRQHEPEQRPFKTVRQTMSHPLEPLTQDEVQLAVTILKDAGKVTPTTRFISVSLKEPAKEIVHALDQRASRVSGGSERAANAVLFDNATNSCYETAV